MSRPTMLSPPTTSSPWSLRSPLQRSQGNPTKNNNQESGGDQTAQEIFCPPKALPMGNQDSEKEPATTKLSHGTSRRVGTVDGRKVEFELLENFTQRPSETRTSRMKNSHTAMKNGTARSKWEIRARWWLMQWEIYQLTFYYLIMFLVVNFIFAAFWVIQDEKCCDDATLSYLEVFDFSVQTSTTIGYGGYVPEGRVANFLVVMLSIFALALSSIYTGLVFSRFTTPSAKIEFSDVLTLSNVNGVPCLEFRIGNADGMNNRLIDGWARFVCIFVLTYTDENGKSRTVTRQAVLKLLFDNPFHLDNLVWTVQHVIDEQSPLFGIDFFEPPGSQIIDFRVTFRATQEITGSSIYAQTDYEIEDIMIGHRFQDHIELKQDNRTVVSDHAKISETEPAPVWYPRKREESSRFPDAQNQDAVARDAIESQG